MNTRIDGDDLLDVWVGIAHARPQEGNEILGEAKGAYVPILAMAVHAEDFFLRASNLLEIYDMDVIEIEDIELLRDRMRKHAVDEEILALVDTLSVEQPVAHGSFETYNDDSA